MCIKFWKIDRNFLKVIKKKDNHRREGENKHQSEATRLSTA